ncbi:MAG: hypothetical protein ACI8W1_003297, partial [Candidatus Azotimanducaceae bacterium]
MNQPCNELGTNGASFGGTGAQLAEAPKNKPPMTVKQQIEIICTTLDLGWQRVEVENYLMTGAEKAQAQADYILTEWQALDRPCPEQVIDQAMAFASARKAAYDPLNSYLSHGDAHIWYTLEALKSPTGYKFVDPDGLFAEHAMDLAILLREWREELLAGDTQRAMDKSGNINRANHPDRHQSSLEQSMKALHKNNLYCWSQFDESRNIDFHSYVWIRDGGNVIFDPLPLTDHDKNHLNSLGKVSHIIISNSDHVRNALELADETGAEIWGPAGERGSFPIPCSKWLGENMDLIEGLDVYALAGSKTAGELAFVIEGQTLITGDLIRAHKAGELCILPNAKLENLPAAINSVKKLAEIKGITAILPGDGWPIFRDGGLV